MLLFLVQKLKCVTTNGSCICIFDYRFPLVDNAKLPSVFLILKASNKGLTEMKMNVKLLNC